MFQVSDVFCLAQLKGVPLMFEINIFSNGFCDPQLDETLDSSVGCLRKREPETQTRLLTGECPTESLSWAKQPHTTSRGFFIMLAWDEKEAGAKQSFDDKGSSPSNYLPG